MNQADAYQILADELSSYRDMPHADLRTFIGQTSSRHVVADDSTTYLVEITVSWFDREEDEVLIEGMTAVTGAGPLRRLDRSFISTRSGIRAT